MDNMFIPIVHQKQLIKQYIVIDPSSIIIFQSRTNGIFCAGFFIFYLLRSIKRYEQYSYYTQQHTSVETNLHFPLLVFPVVI